MALRLSEYILEGYFNNRRRNCTFGHMTLRGVELPIAFELTGDAGEALRGRSFEFTARGVTAEGDAAPKELARHQIGPTGTMDLDMAKIPQGDLRKLMKGEALRFEWKPRLYLEWYSQNGRVVIELVDPEIRLMEGDPIPEPETPTEESLAGGPSITAVQQFDDGHTEVRTYRPAEAAGEEEGIDAYLERLNEETEARMRGEDPEFLRQMEIMESSIAGDAGEVLGSLLEPKQLPPALEVDEERAEVLVKCLLTELAMLNVAVHLCEHCTMREAYRYLVEEILQEGRVHPELKTTGWVQNYSYTEECAACAERLEAEWEARRNEFEAEEE